MYPSINPSIFLFSEMFSELEIWHHPVIVLNTITIKTMRLLLEFIYKGVVQMKEERIESFLEAGKFLHVKGVSVNDKDVQLEDIERSSEVEEITPDRVFNSTMSSDDCQTMENLREADHPRSFIHDISHIR